MSLDESLELLIQEDQSCHFRNWPLGEMATKNNTVVPESDESHRPSHRYVIALMSAFVLAFVSHTNYKASDEQAKVVTSA